MPPPAEPFGRPIVMPVARGTATELDAATAPGPGDGPALHPVLERAHHYNNALCRELWEEQPGPATAAAAMFGCAPLVDLLQECNPGLRGIGAGFVKALYVLMMTAYPDVPRLRAMVLGAFQGTEVLALMARTGVTRPAAQHQIHVTMNMLGDGVPRAGPPAWDPHGFGRATPTMLMPGDIRGDDTQRALAAAGPAQHIVFSNACPRPAAHHNEAYYNRDGDPDLRLLLAASRIALSVLEPGGAFCAKIQALAHNGVLGLVAALACVFARASVVHGVGESDLGPDGYLICEGFCAREDMPAAAQAAMARRLAGALHEPAWLRRPVHARVAAGCLPFFARRRAALRVALDAVQRGQFPHMYLPDVPSVWTAARALLGTVAGGRLWTFCEPLPRVPRLPGALQKAIREMPARLRAGRPAGKPAGKPRYLR